MTDQRPTSPHIQVYRWQYTMLLSILHRASGIALSIGALVLVAWLLAMAAGPDSYDRMQSLIGSNVGVVMLFGWTWALFYHLLNGLRHLFWDIGMGFELPQAFSTGITVVIGSVILTGASWFIGLSIFGGT